MIAYADKSIQNEVHLKDLLFFVIDNIFFLLLAEMTRFKAEGDIVEELAILVRLRVEEETEVVEYVIKKVVHDNASLYLPWKCIDELIVFLNLTESVILPKVLEVLINLAIQTVWQRFVSEPCQKGHPIVQIESLLLVAQILIERRNDFNERAHNV